MHGHPIATERVADLAERLGLEALLDEPTGNQDDERVGLVIGALRSAAAAGPPSWSRPTTPACSTPQAS